MKFQDIIKNKKVGDEITWFDGLEYTTATITKIYTSPYTSDRRVAVQDGNTCFILDEVGFTQQTVIGGTVEDIERHNSAWNEMEAASLEQDS